MFDTLLLNLNKGVHNTAVAKKINRPKQEEADSNDVEDQRMLQQ